METNTELIIVGAGAAGLMATATAGEAAIKAITLERRHRPGLKLLLCGNNRCNISYQAQPKDMLRDYGEPLEQFLKTAINEFTSDDLRKLMAKWGLQTIANRNRIYPASEKADDVLHCFTDKIRDLEAPIVFNCPVEAITPLENGGFLVKTNKINLTAKYVLLATGGFSYPKTGSVGDGQRIAKELGLKVEDPRPGLAGIDIKTPWLQQGEKEDVPNIAVEIFDENGRNVGMTRGNLLVEGNCLRGTAIFDATRIVARQNLQIPSFVLDLFPTQSASALSSRLGKANLAASLEKQGIPPLLSRSFAELSRKLNASEFLKQIRLEVDSIRPLKEAIVTVGGVSLDEIDPTTMEARKIPGLYFAGELADIDGPTGGYNLHAAFATARLAINAIKAKLRPEPKEKPKPTRNFTKQEPRQAAKTTKKRSSRGDRWDAPEPPPWRRRPQ